MLSFHPDYLAHVPHNHGFVLVSWLLQFKVIWTNDRIVDVPSTVQRLRNLNRLTHLPSHYLPLSRICPWTHKKKRKRKNKYLLIASLGK